MRPLNKLSPPKNQLNTNKLATNLKNTYIPLAISKIGDLHQTTQQIVSARLILHRLWTVQFHCENLVRSQFQSQRKVTALTKHIFGCDVAGRKLFPNFLNFFYTLFFVIILFSPTFKFIFITYTK